MTQCLPEKTVIVAYVTMLFRDIGSCCCCSLLAKNEKIGKWITQQTTERGYEFYTSIGPPFKPKCVTYTAKVNDVVIKVTKRDSTQRRWFWLLIHHQTQDFCVSGKTSNERFWKFLLPFCGMDSEEEETERQKERQSSAPVACIKKERALAAIKRHR